MSSPHRDTCPRTCVDTCVLPEPATEYELSVLGFTAKREGSLSDPARVETDTAKPSPPTITNVNCTGAAAWTLEMDTKVRNHGEGPH